MKSPGRAEKTANDQGAQGSASLLGPLLARIEKVDLLVQQQLHIQQARFDLGPEAQQGLVITPQQIVAQLREPIGFPRWASAQPKALPTEIELPLEPGSRLGLMKRRFDLSAIDIDLLLFSLLPFFDPRYGMIFAYMQDDVRRRLPSVDLALNIFSRTLEEKFGLQQRLIHEAPLVRQGLVAVGESDDGYAGQWNQRSLLGDVQIFHHLIGHEYLPEVIAGCCRYRPLSESRPAFDEPVIEDIQIAAFGMEADGNFPLLTLAGPGAETDGPDLYVEASRHAGRRVLEVDLVSLSRTNDAGDRGRDRRLNLLFREATLSDSCLLLRGLEGLGERGEALLAELTAHVSNARVPVAYTGVGSEMLPNVKGRVRQRLELRPSSPVQSAAALERALARVSAMPIDVSDLTRLARKFGLSAGAVDEVVAEARLLSCRRGRREGPAAADLSETLALRSRQSFGRLASRVTPTRTLDDLVLTPALAAQVEEIRLAVLHRETALDMGFARKLGYGFGVSALFHGGSGTGKTMAAEVLAATLGTDLIRIDLSTVVNKYIGETEKNLSRIFDLAEADAGVLFFDEADALFGKRSEVRDAHDRHANIEVAYLLQRLENYPGLVILASNNRGHLDDAFTRRLTFIVRFQPPDAAQRAEMWRRIWPKDMPLSEDIDPVAMGQRYEVTGANIRNIALLATWLAIDAGTPVTRENIDRAALREMAKSGQIHFKSAKG